MFLNRENFEAVNNAMIAMNKVGGCVHVRITLSGGTMVHVKEYLTDMIEVWYGIATDEQPVRGQVRETYRNQEEFRKAHLDRFYRNDVSLQHRHSNGYFD